MAEKTNVPEIRFAGFTDPWEQRKLSELTTMHARIGWQNLRTYEFLDSGNYYLITGTDFENGYVNLSTCHYVNKDRYDQDPNIQIDNGSILITKDGTLGKVALVQGLDKPATLNAGVFNVVIRNEKIVDNGYLYQYLKAPFLLNYVAQTATGGTIKHLNQNILIDFPVSMPSKGEQELIGDAFLRLDNLITLHQRKYDKLCAVKKSMLDKMFPKPGEVEPEIRFAGFTDPWEQRKFSDLTDRISIQSSDSDLPQVEYEDIIPGEGTLNKELRDKEGGKTGIKFYAGDVLYGKLRPYLMNYLYPQFNGVAVGDFWVLRATECDSSFLYRLVQTDSFQRLANVSSGSKMPRADWNLISQSFFAVPADHAEQKVIAKSLAGLDNLITLHQRELNLLKNTKKSLLDKMFV